MTRTRITLMALLIAACGGAATAVQLQPIPTATDEWEIELVDDDLDCQTDADCTVLERPDCCGCTAGGVQGPVSVRRKAEVEARVAAACAGVACPDVMSNDVTCMATKATCVDSTCHLARQE